ncbi:MAG: hypothetical protein JO157_03895 [Acetobacteraceae bacterium]|nr:hypothetical protein [Acetobacteraceae bacterium]
MPEPAESKPAPAGEPVALSDAQVAEAAEYYLESDNLPQGISENDTDRIKSAAEKLERERLQSPNPKLRPDFTDT